MRVSMSPNNNWLLVVVVLFLDFDLSDELDRFLRLLEEAEHFCRLRQHKVAKSVPYGLPRYRRRSLGLTLAAFFAKPHS
jgi:hypothetical protein